MTTQNEDPSPSARLALLMRAMMIVTAFESIFGMRPETIAAIRGFARSAGKTIEMQYDRRIRLVLEVHDVARLAQGYRDGATWSVHCDEPLGPMFSRECLDACNDLLDARARLEMMADRLPIMYGSFDGRWTDDLGAMIEHAVSDAIKPFEPTMSKRFRVTTHLVFEADRIVTDDELVLAMRWAHEGVQAFASSSPLPVEGAHLTSTGTRPMRLTPDDHEA